MQDGVHPLAMFPVKKPPTSLFRYRALDLRRYQDAAAHEVGLPHDFDEGRPGSLASSLLNGILYVPAIEQFNDPWECSPSFRLTKGQEAVELASLCVRLQPQGEGGGPWIAADLHRQIEEIGATCVLSMMQRALRDMFVGRRVLCLAEDPAISLMWSYYAGGHKGYVIEFDATVRPFVMAQPTKYARAYPRIDPRRVLTPMHAFEKTLLVKSSDWRHEREWRVFGSKDNTVFDWIPETPESVGSGPFVRLPKGSIRRVIAGARMAGDDYKKIQQIAAKADPPIPVVRCELAADLYRVEVPRHE